MNATARPYRSVLYIPGANPRAMAKAAGLAADAIIFDLEDAVAPDAKEEARVALVEALNTHDYGPRRKIVRINGFDTDLAEKDLEAALSVAPDAILVPKVNSAADIAPLAERLEGSGLKTSIWAMMETPTGVLAAAEIARAPRMEGFVLGTNDLAKELGSRSRADRMPMQTSLQLCLLAARAAGIIAVDGVYNAFKDDEGLWRECKDGRDMGFDGKTLIHPAQLAIANEAFGPSRDEIDLAERQIAAFAAAKAEGKGVAVVDGKIVENLHVATAEALLTKAAMIAEMEGNQ